MNYGWEIAKIAFYLIFIVAIIYLLSYPLKKKIGENNKLVKQLVDLALLSNNMLKGESLSKFVKRSIDLIEK